MKRFLLKNAIRGERIWDRLKPSGKFDSPYIDPFIGYASPEGLHVRGRVLNGSPVADLPADSSRWSNFRNMIARFITREIPDIELVVEGLSTTTDEEGYFAIDLPVGDRERKAVEAHLPGHEASASLPVVIPGVNARFGIISDIDDTLIRTQAWSLRRNIYNTLTGNVASRQIFPDSVAFLQALHNGVNPVFYISSSPWNLHAFLVEIFSRNDLIRGPLFLRDLGISEDKFIKGSHGEHKGSMIDKVLEANPSLQFVLIGDTGQHDPEIYHAAVARHPDRFLAAWFRVAGREVDARDRQWIEKIRGLCVEAHATEAFEADRGADLVALQLQDT
ncbi:phosphatase domain-containing protein [Hoeflea sp. CAU 1731]